MEKRGRDSPYDEAGASRTHLREIAEDIGVTALVAWCCFDSWWGLLSGIAVAVLNRVRHRRIAKQKYDAEFRIQYREMLVDLINSLSAGISIEGAFRNAESELRALYGEECLLLLELQKLNANVKLSISVEQAFSEFALHFPYEEVLDFSELFSFAKRLGGNYAANIRKTATSIGEKVELHQEIDAITAEKRMELNIMCMMPIGILLYLKIGSPDFISALYHNPAGIAVVCIALLIYAGSMMLGQWMIEASA